MATKTDFDTSVFINCPFDDDYKPLMWAIVFAILSCGFSPRSAMEENDAAAIRLDKIKSLIEDSRMGIHDISRTELDKDSNLPRFNMPFELGIDLGAREYGNRELQRKKVLIFDSEKHRFQKFLSDIAGQDIFIHENSTSKVIAKVRSWLNNIQATGKPLLGAEKIEASFKLFYVELPNMCKDLALDHKQLDFKDFVYFAGAWIESTA